MQMAPNKLVFPEDVSVKISEQFLRFKGATYLDNAGSSLYAKCQIEAVHENLLKHLHLNPHSSKASTDLIDQVRYEVLDLFNTTPDEYSLIFTSGSTAALKLVAETFRFEVLPDYHNENDGIEYKNGAFGYLTDNHTSVLGMRELAKWKQADVFYFSPDEFVDILDGDEDISDSVLPFGNGLFVYPAESNFNGVKYPLHWIAQIQKGKLNTHKPCSKWYVFLDTAIYASTSRLNLAEIKPDFLCVSFYKMFGYPTGLGALLVKNSSAHILSEKAYFGGGTVDAVLSGGDYHVKRDNIIHRFEDGTVSFLSILAVKHGLDALHSLVPKIINNNTMESISRHTFLLAKQLYEILESLYHYNNAKAVKLYNDTDYTDEKYQGGIVNFNLLRSTGGYIGYAEVSHMAELFNVHIRVGSFCNTGSCQRHLNLTNEEYKMFYEAGHVCGDENDLIDGKPTGCVRVSFGYMNTQRDIDALLAMICRCFIDGTPIFMPLRGNPYESRNNMFENTNSATPTIVNTNSTTLNTVHSNSATPNTVISNGIKFKAKDTDGSMLETLNTNETVLKIVNNNDKIPIPMNIDDNLPKLVNIDGTLSKIVNFNGTISKPMHIMKNNALPVTEENVSPMKCLDLSNYMKVQSICIYPIKSCAPYVCSDKWIIGCKGLLFDREWMVIKESGTVLTQKDQTKMCLIKPFFDFDDNILILSYPDMHNISIPLNLRIEDSEIKSSLCRSKVCGDRITGYDCGDEVGDWLSNALNIFGLRLIRQSNEVRPSTSKSDRDTLSLTLANQAQYLLINRASVQWLANEVESREFDNCIDNLVNRFRGNIIIDSNKAFAENDWKEVVIAGKLFKVEGPCMRCQMVCINQETSYKTTEPLRTISRVFQGKMRFGVYLSYTGRSDGHDNAINCGDNVYFSDIDTDLFK